MNSEEFHRIRKPFFIHPDTLLVIFPASKHMNVSHAQWFTDMGYIFMHTVRGYYWKDDEDEYIMLYWNDFEIPNVNAAIFSYLFDYFPTIKWIGMGCHKGEEGQVWKPKLKITRIKNG